MKAFNFPLESLRTLRKQREQAAQQRYARALVTCDGAMQALRLAEEELNVGRGMLVDELGQGAAAARIVSLRTWCKVLEIRRDESATALEDARRIAGEAFRILTAAAREREALDRFFNRSQKQWQRECLMAEQKMFDELAVQRQSAQAYEKTRLN